MCLNPFTPEPTVGRGRIWKLCFWDYFSHFSSPNLKHSCKTYVIFEQSFFLWVCHYPYPFHQPMSFFLLSAVGVEICLLPVFVKMFTLTLHCGCSFVVQWACEEKVSLDEIRNLGNLDFNFLWFYFLLFNYLPFKHLSGFLNYLPHQHQMALEMASILQLKLYSHHWVRTWLHTGRNLIQWEEKFYRWHLWKVILIMAIIWPAWQLSLITMQDIVMVRCEMIANISVDFIWLEYCSVNACSAITVYCWRSKPTI